ncbi:MAG: phosphoenolpyruvate carboxykinase (ATP) [Sporomusaceae bacterium]|jgi:phosphoenolpyruvate carboxykinase (ATP)|nr:phosphoenolpyruvate carboxykinase (ATP) [Sporomusaceae bacterium]
MSANNILTQAANVYRNLPAAELVEEALKRGEGSLLANGALRVTTGKYTGRSPNDKFVVATENVKAEIDWQSNKAMTPENFERIFERMQAYAQNKDLFVFDGFVGAAEKYQRSVRYINEFAWQNLFVRQLFIRPEPNYTHSQVDFEVICLPNFKADPAIDGTNSEAFIIINFEKRLILIAGTHYAGEMKKSIFTIMNYLLPKQGILPMHCSANVGEKGDAALFFGLSGTGKTTLSADPARRLVGDDEHGWSEQGIFNFEGGCYAKCINLSKEQEPQIYAAIKFGSVLENVAVQDRREPDYASNEITENTRVAYPLEYIPGVVLPSVASHPSTVVFLTADAFGVLPPVSKLNKEQAAYHFLSGYTSKLAGTERGITAPEATFSTCFGSPFLPLSPLVYAKLLSEKVEKHNTNVFLINTGWTGGLYGVGKRMSIAYTRAIVTAAIEGKLNDVPYELDPIFNLSIPTQCPNVPSEVLKPSNTWADKAEYERYARELAALFKKNFAKFSADMPQEIINAGPQG